MLQFKKKCYKVYVFGPLAGLVVSIPPHKAGDGFESCVVQLKFSWDSWEGSDSCPLKERLWLLEIAFGDKNVTKT